MRKRLTKDQVKDDLHRGRKKKKRRGEGETQPEKAVRWQLLQWDKEVRGSYLTSCSAGLWKISQELAYDGQKRKKEAGKSMWTRGMWCCFGWHPFWRRKRILWKAFKLLSTLIQSPIKSALSLSSICMTSLMLTHAEWVCKCWMNCKHLSISDAD